MGECGVKFYGHFQRAGRFRAWRFVACTKTGGLCFGSHAADVDGITLYGGNRHECHEQTCGYNA